MASYVFSNLLMIGVLFIFRMTSVHSTSSIDNDTCFHVEDCLNLNMQKSVVQKFRNITATVGTKVEIDCDIFNFGSQLFSDQKAQWIAENFEASANREGLTEITTGQIGMTVVTRQLRKNITCFDFFPINGNLIVSTMRFKLIVYPNLHRTGWYTCHTNYSIPTGGGYFSRYSSSHSFYLSVSV